MNCRRVACPDCRQWLYHDDDQNDFNAPRSDRAMRTRFQPSTEPCVVEWTAAAGNTPNRPARRAERGELTPLPPPGDPDEIAREVAKIRGALMTCLRVVRIEP